MGRKGRRNRSNSDSHEESNANTDESSNAPIEKNDGPSAADKGDVKDLDFAQRRELQRQQAAEKRRTKQKCFLCGRTGHVRRECPGIADDGRGMSRFKGKSDPKHEKKLYVARRQARSSSGSHDTDSESLVASLEYPEEFSKDRGVLSYFDVHCDIPATIDYLRSGRGKAKISQKEAIEEYQAAMKIATERSHLKAVVSRTFLEKPNRPWINPVTFEIDGVDVYFAVGLADTWKLEIENEPDPTIECLVSAVQNNDEFLAIYASLDLTSASLEKPGMDFSSQIGRFHCCWEAAGQADVPLQIQLLPGAASLDPEQDSVAGTDYAKALLEFQANLTSAIKKYPDLRVHLIGWSGQASHMMALLQAFPTNIAAVGLDGAVTFSKATHLHECAFEVPLDRLVLETSNVIPSNVANSMGRAAFCQSGWWPFLAESIANYKKIVTMDQVVTAAYETTLRLYPQLKSCVAARDNSRVSEDSKDGKVEENVQNNE